MTLRRRLILVIATTAVASSGDTVSLKFTENLASFTADDANVINQFTVKVNGVAATINAVSLSGNNTVVLGVYRINSKPAMR